MQGYEISPMILGKRPVSSDHFPPLGNGVSDYLREEISNLRNDIRNLLSDPSEELVGIVFFLTELAKIGTKRAWK